MFGRRNHATYISGFSLKPYLYAYFSIRTYHAPHGANGIHLDCKPKTFIAARFRSYVNHFNERFWNPGLAFYNQPLSNQKKHLSSNQPLYLFLRSVVSKGCVENEKYFNFFLAGGWIRDLPLA